MKMQYNWQKRYVITSYSIHYTKLYDTRDFIIEENPDVIINVVDSTNLERNLYLTMLLKELGKPMIMALNFLDEFEKLNYTLDRLNFEKHLEMDAIPTSAIKNKGIQELLEKAIEVAKT